LRSDAKVKILKFPFACPAAPVVIAQDSFVQLGPISSGENKHGGSIPSTKKASTPSEMTSQSDWLYILQAPSSSEES